MAQNIYFNPFLAPSGALGLLLVYYIPSSNISGHFSKLFRFGAILPICRGFKDIKRDIPLCHEGYKGHEICISLHFIFNVLGQFGGAYRPPMDAIFNFGMIFFIFDNIGKHIPVPKKSYGCTSNVQY